VKIDAGDRTIEIGNPDKVLFPDDGITKADVARYYERIAGVMVPHVRHRPLTMHRFPDGIGADGFYQKQVPGSFPDWIVRETVSKEDGEVTQVVCDDAATLVFLADQGCITPHVWLSTTDHLEAPDRLVFDLDPPEDGTVAAARFAARRIRDLLDDLGLEGRLMTTGSSGYHVVVPIDGTTGFDDVRAVARRCARVLAGRPPDRLTTETRIDRREGRVFLDYLRNGFAQTTVAPYALRAKPGAPAAVPIDWDELSSTDPQRYTIENLFRRLGQKDDPWAADGLGPQPIDRAADRLAGFEG
jgi:bifunctional non-homologous end joining protein LigD